MTHHFNISNLLFQPWVGQHYGPSSLFKIPVLIVGESNYGEPRASRAEDELFTQTLIQNFIGRTWNLRFFSNIQRCFVEHADSQASRQEFWHSVAFYDYIQSWLPKPGVPPTDEMWTTARPVFEELLLQLQPGCILFVCKRLYYRFISQSAIQNKFPITEKNRDACIVGHAPASYILHPSRNGFRNARPLVQALITLAGGQPMLDEKSSAQDPT